MLRTFQLVMLVFVLFVSISAFTSHRTGSSSQQIRVNLGVNSAASYLEFSTVDPNLATRHLRICAIEKGGCRTSTNEKFKRDTGKKTFALRALRAVPAFLKPAIFPRLHLLTPLALSSNQPSHSRRVFFASGIIRSRLRIYQRTP